MKYYMCRDFVGNYILRFVCAFAFGLSMMTAQASSLDGATIESFLAAQMEVLAYFDSSSKDKMEDYDEDDEEGFSFDLSAEDFVEQLKMNPVRYQDITGIVNRYGFESVDEWASIGERIFLAYWAISSEGQPQGAAREGMESYLKSLEDMGGMPEEALERTRKLMEGMVQVNEAASNAPRADIEAVRPYMDKIAEASQMIAPDEQ